MNKYWKDKDTGKWTDGTIYLGCGQRIQLNYNGEVVVGTIEYSDMWDGGYYLVLDDGKGSLPMFGTKMEGELL